MKQGFSYVATLLTGTPSKTDKGQKSGGRASPLHFGVASPVKRSFAQSFSEFLGWTPNQTLSCAGPLKKLQQLTADKSRPRGKVGLQSLAAEDLLPRKSRRTSQDDSPHRGLTTVPDDLPGIASVTHPAAVEDSPVQDGVAARRRFFTRAGKQQPQTTFLKGTRPASADGISSSPAVGASPSFFLSTQRRFAPSPQAATPGAEANQAPHRHALAQPGFASQWNTGNGPAPSSQTASPAGEASPFPRRHASARPGFASQSNTASRLAPSSQAASPAAEASLFPRRHAPAQPDFASQRSIASGSVPSMQAADPVAEASQDPSRHAPAQPGFAFQRNTGNRSGRPLFQPSSLFAPDRQRAFDDHARLGEKREASVLLQSPPAKRQTLASPVSGGGLNLTQDQSPAPAPQLPVRRLRKKTASRPGPSRLGRGIPLRPASAEAAPAKSQPVHGDPDFIPGLHLMTDTARSICAAFERPLATSASSGAGEAALHAPPTALQDDLVPKSRAKLQAGEPSLGSFSFKRTIDQGTGEAEAPVAKKAKRGYGLLSESDDEASETENVPPASTGQPGNPFKDLPARKPEESSVLVELLRNVEPTGPRVDFGFQKLKPRPLEDFAKAGAREPPKQVSKAPAVPSLSKLPAEPTASPPAASGWSADFLAANRAQSTVASHQIEQLINNQEGQKEPSKEGSQAPAEPIAPKAPAVPTPSQAPAASGWSASFLASNQAQSAVASEQVKKLIENQDTGAEKDDAAKDKAAAQAKPATKPFTFGVPASGASAPSQQNTGAPATMPLTFGVPPSASGSSSQPSTGTLAFSPNFGKGGFTFGVPQSNGTPSEAQAPPKEAPEASAPPSSAPLAIPPSSQSTSAAASKPSSAFSFGVPPAVPGSEPASSPAPQTGGTFSFGVAPASTPGPTAPGTAADAEQSSGAVSFGAKPAAAPASESAPPTSPSGGLFSFGAQPTSQPAPGVAGQPSTITFGAPSAASQPASAPSSQASMFSFGVGSSQQPAKEPFATPVRITTPASDRTGADDGGYSPMSISPPKESTGAMDAASRPFQPAPQSTAAFGGTGMAFGGFGSSSQSASGFGAFGSNPAGTQSGFTPPAFGSSAASGFAAQSAASGFAAQSAASGFAAQSAAAWGGTNPPIPQAGAASSAQAAQLSAFGAVPNFGAPQSAASWAPPPGGMSMGMGAAQKPAQEERRKVRARRPARK